ncbi:MAG: hypothetical protein LBC74_11340, partial [Planctomycetaceae bacterium]|nr:hypothetical protein [Planctomycetaceae bacterium]
QKNYNKKPPLTPPRPPLTPPKEGNKKTPPREANYSPPKEGSGVLSEELAKRSSNLLPFTVQLKNVNKYFTPKEVIHS